MTGMVVVQCTNTCQPGQWGLAWLGWRQRPVGGGGGRDQGDGVLPEDSQRLLREGGEEGREKGER